MRDRTRLIFALVFGLIALSIANGAEIRKEIPASQVQAIIEAGQPAEFDNCTIIGDLNLGALKIEGPVHFNHTLFQDSVKFNSATFNSTVYFWGTEFNGDAYFWGTRFKGDAIFADSGFNAYTDFVGSDFKGDAIFVDSGFNSNADFSDSAFNGTADFSDSAFNGTADFSYSDFNSYAGFEGSAFNSYAGFKGSAFNGTADFRNSAFNSYAGFKGSAFNGNADFRNSDFNGNADFSEVAFNGHAYFSGSDFNGNADFSKVAFSGHAYFCGSDFNGNADFSETQFNEIANFEDARFDRIASFNSSLFKEDALFECSDFNCTLYLTRTKYDKLDIRWRDIKDLAYDDAAYLSLMENFKKLGYLEDYDNCYYEYRKERRDQDWSGKYHGIGSVEESFRKRIDAGLEIFYGYGKRPLNPLYWSIGTILLFGLIWRIGGLRRDKGRNQKGIFEKYGRGDMNILRKPHQSLNLQSELYVLADAMLFSATVFLSSTKLFINPPEIPELPGWSRFTTKAAFTAERILGAFFSILFFLAIGATVVR